MQLTSEGRTAERDDEALYWSSRRRELKLMRFPPKLIYVFGCDHYLQKKPIGSFTQDPKIEGYRKELKRLAQTYRFDIYC